MDKLLDRMIDYLYGRKLSNDFTNHHLKEPWEREAFPSVWANSKGDMLLFVPDLTNLFSIQRIFLITHANAPAHICDSWSDPGMQAWWRDVFRMLSILNFGFDYIMINHLIKTAKTKEDYEEIEQRFFGYEDKNITAKDVRVRDYYDNNGNRIAKMFFSPFAMKSHKITVNSDLLDKYNPIDRTDKTQVGLLPLFMVEFEGDNMKSVFDIQIGDMLYKYYKEWEDIYFGRVPYRPTDDIGTSILLDAKANKTFFNPYA
ncbi:MAG: hypothetical protein ACP5MB_11325, partial [bacterium]